MAWPSGVAKWRGRKIDGVAKKFKEWGGGHWKWPLEVVLEVAIGSVHAGWRF